MDSLEADDLLHEHEHEGRRVMEVGVYPLIATPTPVSALRMLSGQVGYWCTGAIVTLVVAALARELPDSPFRLRLGS